MDWSRGFFVGLIRLIVAVIAVATLSLDLTSTAIEGIDSAQVRTVASVAALLYLLLTLFHEAERYLAGRPRIECVGSRPAEGQIVHTLQNGRKLFGSGQFLRCAFRNRPGGSVRESATARDLHATISIRREGKTLQEWSGRWADLEEAQSPADKWGLDRIDLPPNGQVATLDLLVRSGGEHALKPWTNARFSLNGDPEHDFSDEEYDLRVELAGANLRRKTFKFRIRNPQGEPPLLLLD